MPSSILNTDIMFPNLSGKSTEQQVFTIMNYLYMLKEQLTYSLSNLGLDNINANSFIEIAGMINQPVILRLDGVDGSLAEINVNLGTVSTQLKDAEATSRASSRRRRASAPSSRTLRETSRPYIRYRRACPPAWRTRRGTSRRSSRPRTA